jgi:hypothetical protein
MTEAKAFRNFIKIYSLYFYCCVFFGMCSLGRRLTVNVLLLLYAGWLEVVYRAVAWQSVDQIRYNIKSQ